MDWTEFKNIFADVEIIDDKIVIKNNVHETLLFIKNNYKFEMLKEIIAIDKRHSEAELIYNLYSLSNDENVLVSVTVNNETDSVSDIFDSAVADEKEIYDLFGVRFNGNNELKRLYMPDGWHGNPLRKDYEEKDERLSWND